MKTVVERLRNLEAEALQICEIGIAPEFEKQKRLYETRIEKLEQSHSRSWFGDHSSTYYEGFEPPPARRSFDVEWGFVSGYRGSHNPGWETYTRDEIRQYVFNEIGEDIFYEFHSVSEETLARYSSLHDQVLDALEALESQVEGSSIGRYLARLKDSLSPYTSADFVNSRIASLPRMTRDSEEIAKGQSVPQHVQYLSVTRSLEINKGRARELAGLLRNVIEILNFSASSDSSTASTRKVFIGHGASPLWRELKDFLTDRLSLEYEEFNRVPTAGLGTQERLSEMLAGCGFAFLVLTGEDMHQDKSVHARENVVHEAGLFQGKLGWRRAIVLLEDGCEEFSNIVGLGQIRFPKGAISSSFEDVRRVLEREKILQ